MITDPIADMLTRIRNAYMARHVSVDIPYSKEKEGIAKVLAQYSFLSNVTVSGLGKDKIIGIELTYDEKGASVMKKLRRISKPSVRTYRRSKEIKPVRGGFGLHILSTNKGIMSHEDARKNNVGGEVLVEVY